MKNKSAEYAEKKKQHTITTIEKLNVEEKEHIAYAKSKGYSENYIQGIKEHFNYLRGLVITINNQQRKESEMKHSKKIFELVPILKSEEYINIYELDGIIHIKKDESDISIVKDKNFFDFLRVILIGEKKSIALLSEFYPVLFYTTFTGIANNQYMRFEQGTDLIVLEKGEGLNIFSFILTAYEGF